MSVVKNSTKKSSKKQTVNPVQSEVKAASKKTTQKQLSQFEIKMAALTLRQEQESFGLAYVKELEQQNKKRPGVILSILNFISSSDKPVNQSQVLAHLMEQFPKREEKSMTNTIKAQIGGKKRPLRMEHEKRVIFEITQNNAGVKAYSIDFVEEIEDKA